MALERMMNTFWQAFPPEDRERGEIMVMNMCDLMEMEPLCLKMTQVFERKDGDYRRLITCYQGPKGMATVHVLLKEDVPRLLSLVVALNRADTLKDLGELWESFLKGSLFLATPPQVSEDLTSYAFATGFRDLIAADIDPELVWLGIALPPGTEPACGIAHQ